MRKLLKNIALLALAVAVVIFLHNRVKQEIAEATEKKAAQSENEQTQEQTLDTQSMSVMHLSEGITLGRLEENTERGGVNVTVPQPDGSSERYTFTDVAVDSWYADAVNFVVSAGLMTGGGNGDRFRPEYGMPRESFAVILYRYTNGEPVEPQYHFEDVEDGNWYCDAVNWVTNERLMTGLDSSTFGVGDFLTCEQALVGLYRVAGEPETDGSLADYPYAAKVSDFGRNAIDWAWKNGLITEVECVWYPPQAISRAQVALLLMRYSAMTS